MSTNLARRPHSPGAPTTEIDELHDTAVEDAGQSVMRTMLRPQDEGLSLPPSLMTLPTPVTSLTHFLGPMLTVANPVWSGDPVPALRGLQKKLVEHSLTLEEGTRADFMEAIKVVECAVRLRLRYQQMRMNEAEADAEPTKATTAAKAESAGEK
jgi:hypothetical protein